MITGDKDRDNILIYGFLSNINKAYNTKVVPVPPMDIVKMIAVFYTIEMLHVIEVGVNIAFHFTISCHVRVM